MEKPILLKTWEVQAILDNRKTQKRIPTKFKPYTSLNETNGRFEICEPVTQNFFECRADFEKWAVSKCNYQVGDVLWAKETWAKIEDFKNYTDAKIDADLKYLYKCDDNGKEHVYIDIGVQKWHSPIHMPREAARIFLKITNVRVERLKDITADGIKSEGLTSMAAHCGDMEIALKELKNILKCNDTDWLWVIEFERVDGK